MCDPLSTEVLARLEAAERERDRMRATLMWVQVRLEDDWGMVHGPDPAICHLCQMKRRIADVINESAGPAAQPLDTSFHHRRHAERMQDPAYRAAHEQAAGEGGGPVA